ncbi:MAG: efflux RND transporter periplasmic adaptor subunit [Syntrophales bacterium]|nr:efflux RND transporter periplasmic adaptor subunit [Syntrophales bacterium]
MGTRITRKRIFYLTSTVLLLLGTILFFYRCNNANPRLFRTEKVARGDIQSVITATGKVDAVTTVIVGAQLSGMIKELHVDYNSKVKKGQLLARIDPALYEAQVEQARANLLLAKANLEKAEAQARDAQRTLSRYEKLIEKNFISRSELDTAMTNLETAEAQVKAAKAQYEQAKASLKTAETNLRYTQIRSPVDGIVISRNVDVGQTVTASLQTPTLFSIAQDLTKMQVVASVAEADIGRVKTGQPVQFTVDAYPDHVFEGKVHEVRNAPINVQNVVTYEVIARVENSDLKLKPGMTANVSIITNAKKNVPKVPNTALRFRMPDEIRKKLRKTNYESEKRTGVWILTPSGPKRVAVKTGISDMNYTEVLSGELKEGDEVIVDVLVKKKDSAVQPRFIR